MFSLIRYHHHNIVCISDLICMENTITTETLIIYRINDSLLFLCALVVVPLLPSPERGEGVAAATGEV